MAANYGATAFDGIAEAPLPLRVAMTLGFRESETHPAGMRRAEVVTDGYLAQKSGVPSRLLVPRDDEDA